ncbi:MAG: hypothetical protein NTX27_06965 [Verrucomicrobia bacterium]|nr:hypothetical protein [Verrucomicrobiota bacterium]
MSDKFVPFTARSSSPSSPAPVFSPHTALNHTAAAPPNSLIAPVPKPTSAPPEMTLVREGDRVTMIRISCSCGMVHEIQCQY